MPAIDYTIGTIISVKKEVNDYHLSGVDRCLYDHDPADWQKVIARSKRCSRFEAVATLRYVHGKARFEISGVEDRIGEPLQRRLNADPNLLLREGYELGFTFKL